MADGICNKGVAECAFNLGQIAPARHLPRYVRSLQDRSMNSDSYYAHCRPEMLAYFPNEPGRVLDVGCGNGRFGAMLKTKLRGAEVWGVEPVADAHAEAAKVLDRATLGMFCEDIDLPLASFDTIVFNDSLEHFPDENAPLKLARRLLKPGGRVIASIPNVRYWPHMREYLFSADWRYRDHGILDSTHLRFFTKRSIQRCFNDVGFEVQRIAGINPCWRDLRLSVAKAVWPSGMQDMLYLQFAVVASSKAESNPC